MHSGYLLFCALLLALLLLCLLPSCVYFYLRRSNFLLQTRSPHLLSMVCGATLLLLGGWAAEEVRFALAGKAVSPYLLAAVSHLMLPCTILPLMFRGAAFMVVCDVSLRKRYLSLVRRKRSIHIMAAAVFLLALIPFGVHVLAHPRFFEEQLFGSNLLFGYWPYFLPLFVVYIALQCALLWMLQRRAQLADTLGLITELKFVLLASVLFTLIFFSWLICLDAGVNAGLSEWDNRHWMRLNHLALLLQLSIFARTVLPQLYAVFRHTQQTMKVAALYDAQSKWMKPRARGRSNKVRGLTTVHSTGAVDTTRLVLDRVGSNTTSAATPQSRSRDHSPRVSSWRYSPKVSRQPSPRESSNWSHTDGGGSLFAHSPKIAPRNNDNGVSSVSSQPNSDQRQRLASLHDILRFEESRTLFSEFAAKHLCLESCLFYNAVEAWECHPAWQSLELRDVYDMGCSIYSSFVATGSEFEINVSGDVKAKLKKVFGWMPKPKNSTSHTGKTGFGRLFGRKNRPSDSAHPDAEVGTGTATGSAAQAKQTPSVSGRFEAFLSLPSSKRREMYRAAQDEIYQLLKQNLYLPFVATDEFRELRDAFNAKQERMALMASLREKDKEAGGGGVAPGSEAPLQVIVASVGPNGAQAHSPPHQQRRAMYLASPSASPSVATSPSIHPSRVIHFRMDGGTPTRSRRNSASGPCVHPPPTVAEAEGEAQELVERPLMSRELSVPSSSSSRAHPSHEHRVHLAPHEAGGNAATGATPTQSPASPSSLAPPGGTLLFPSASDSALATPSSTPVQALHPSDSGSSP